MSSEIERLRAERDALASALEEARKVLSDLWGDYRENEDPQYDWINSALSRPLPHHAERVRLERAIVEAARALRADYRQDPYEVGGGPAMGDLLDALAALDAHDKKEQANG